MNMFDPDNWTKKILKGASKIEKKIDNVLGRNQGPIKEPRHTTIKRQKQRKAKGTTTKKHY